MNSRLQNPFVSFWRDIALMGFIAFWVGCSTQNTASKPQKAALKPTPTAKRTPNAPQKSGIYGNIVQWGPSVTSDMSKGPDLFFCWKCKVTVHSARNKKPIKSTYTNSNGNFNIALPPGVYIVHLSPPGGGGVYGNRDNLKVVVWRGYYTRADFTIGSAD